MPRITVCNGSNPVTYDVVEGTTLRGFMEEQYPETKNFPVPTICLFGGKPVLREQWKTTALTGDEIAIFQALPMGGGGSNPLRIVLMVVVMIVAIVAQQYWTTPIIAGGTLTWGTVAGAGIMLAGTMLVNALVPNNPLASGLSGASAAEAASPTYSINSNANQPRLYQIIPEGFGRIKTIPDVVCSPWMRYEKNDMYMYQVFGLGRGVYQQEEMAFGDTVFWKNGKILADSAYVEDDDEYQAQAGETLLTAEQGGGWSAPHLAAPEGIVVQKLSIKITFPDGFCTYVFQDAHFATTETGEGGQVTQWVRGEFVPAEHEFSCEFQIRDVDDAGNPLSGWKSFASGSWPVNTEAIVGWEGDGKDEPRTPVYGPREVVLTGTASTGFGKYELRGKNTSEYVGEITAWETTQSYWGKPAEKIKHTIQAKETAVWSSTDSLGSSIQVQIVPPGGKVTLFPDNVETSPSVAGQVLLAPNAEGHDWQGPFPVCPPGTVTNLISNDLTWPRGLVYFNDKGNEQTISVGWEIQYQRIDDNNQTKGSWAVLDKGSLSMATTTPQRRTIDTPAPEGRYQVRARRTTKTRGDSRTMDEMQWGGLRATLPGKLVYNQSVVAVRTKANVAMSQAASERFSVIQTRKLPVYNQATKKWTGSYDAKTDTWKDCQPTRSFAAAAAWICKSPWGGRLEDRYIDLDGLWTLDAKVAAKGWHYDAWVDGPYNVFALLVEVCGVMGVIPRPGGRLLTFIMQGPDRPVCYEFTPYTIVRGSFKPSWLTFSDNTPDDVSVTYLDENAGFAKRDVRAVLPESESKEPAQRQPIGITSRAHSHAYGVYLSACNRYRRIELEFMTEAIAKMLGVGDVISVRHPRFRNFSSGKMSDWNEKTLSLMLDPAPKLPEDGTVDLYISFTRRDGTPWGPVRVAAITGAVVRLDPADYANILGQGLESPFAWFTRGYDRMPTIWSLHEGREFSRRMIVTKVVPSDTYRHTVHCVNDDPRVYNQNIPVPPWEYRPQASIPAELAAPKSLTARVSGADTALVTWLPVPGATGYEVELSTDGSTWERKGRANINSLTGAVPVGKIWIRVSAVNDTLSSPWAVWSGNISIPVPDAPALTLSAPFVGGSLAISWLPVDRATEYTVCIYTDDGGYPVLVESTTGTSFVFTRAKAVEKGGPWRTLHVEMTASGLSGESAPGALDALDPAPAKIPLANIQANADSSSVTFSVTGSPGTDVTGCVLARGKYPSFLASEVLEMRIVESLPYVWSGLTPETGYHFRLAAKDAFADITGDYASLEYSDSIDVMTEAEAAEAPEEPEE